MRSFIVFFVFMLGLGVTGCKSSKETATNHSKREGNKKTAYILEKVRANEAVYPKSIRFKASSEMKKGETTTSFKTSVRMVSDSVIWMSISAYGYEVARILSTPDSVKFVSRTDKTYYVGDYSFIENKMGVSFGFNELQSLIFAQSFGLEGDEKIKRSAEKESYILTSFKKEKRPPLENVEGGMDSTAEIVFTNWINQISYQIEKVSVLDLGTQNRASIQYTTLENIDAYTLLSSFKMNIIAVENMEIQSSFSKIEVDESLKFPFKISSKYAPVK